MKYAISSTGEDLRAPLDSRFGRTKFFLLFDSESRECTAFPNTQNLQALQGAGIQSAMNVAERGACIVITGHCGPKAFRVLKEAGIEVYLTSAATGAEAVALFENGKLEKAESADVEGHWA